MKEEWFATRESEAVAQPYEGWRCLSCGEVVDPVILRNRQRLKTAHHEVDRAHAHGRAA